MHAGQLATLRAVVDFYADGGATPTVGTLDPRIEPLDLTAADRADLVAFLETLTGEPIDRSLTEDTSHR
jgi:cytochrome c peroxidase